MRKKTRKVVATPRTYSVAFPSAEIGLRPDVPDALPDGTIPVDKLTAPLLVNAPLWDQAYAGDTYWLLLITPGKDPKVVDTRLLEDPLPDVVPLHIPVDELENLAEGQHFLRFAIYTTGFDLLPSLEFVIIIDRTPPGGDVLPAIVFDRDIEEKGLTLAKLLAMPGQKLRGIVPNYANGSRGDVLALKMRLRPDGPEVDAGTFVVADPDREIVVEYDRATLERIDGWGTVDFYFYLSDSAGNRRPDPSVAKPIAMWIKGGPDLLLPPLIPGFDTDGIVTDPDARPYLRIRIPAYEPLPLAGDRFIVHVGNQSMETPPLEPGDIGNDPVLDVDYPYRRLFQSTSEPLDEVFDVDVWYDVVRGGVEVPSPAKHVDFDLGIPGGVDPDPGTPENEALGKAWIQGASGGPINVVKPGDTLVDATVTVPWLNTRTPPGPSFKEGDTIQLYLDRDRVGTPYQVTAQDVIDGVDLTLVMPSDDMQRHTGTPDLWYEVTRVLGTMPPQPVTVAAPRQSITLQALTDLPGEGKPLTPAKWLAPTRRPDADIPEIRQEDVLEDRGTYLRIYRYANMAVGDRVDMLFEGHDGLNPSNPVLPGTQHEQTYIVTETDLVEKDDDSEQPPVKAVYIDMHVPIEHFYPFEHFGSATFLYEVTNDAGTGFSERDDIRKYYIYVAIREPWRLRQP
ncbi:MAG: hypothetical protein GAK28_01983 [Luteibacter sp.]|uniref:hypothetical protein n=1 Tax=Luteibacter sp. TaxID=1886636 RepID=UPI0013815A36|nr:hypothetical protein [Luteibacter sp.]KAF1007344.1 MAG: hypothetical protein GAK28_01983 [Luteibacter sp.]